MKGICLLLFTIFICQIRAFSQTNINGTVNDDQGQPMPVATVKVLTQNKKAILLYAITNDQGYFQINIPDTVKAAAKYICASYLKQTSDTIVLTTRSYQLTIFTGQKLAGITVASQEPLMTRKADRFVFVPNKAMTEGATSLELLRITPLIQFDNRSEALSIINKEGTIVYINNRKSNMPKDMILSQLRSTPAGNIKSIEIITNPGSEYPANSTGGIININLKKMIDEGWFGNVSAVTEQSVYNTSMLNTAVNYRKSKIGIKLSPFVNNSYNYYTADNLMVTTDDRYEQNIRSKYRRYTVIGGGIALDYDISKKDLLSINSFFSTVNGKSHQESQTYYHEDSVSSSPVRGKDHYIYNFGNIYYRHDFDKGKQLTLNIDYNQFYQRNTDIVDFDRTNYKNILPEKFFNFSAAADYSVQIDKRSKVNIGAQVSNTSMTNDLSYSNYNNITHQYETDTSLTRLYKYEEEYLALYISYSIAINDRLNASLGLREEYTHYETQNKTAGITADTGYYKLFPNLSAVYKLSKHSDLSMALSKKIKRANIELLFPGRTYYNANYYSENNPFLQPATVNNIEVMYGLMSKYYITGGFTQGKNQYAQFIVAADYDINQKKTYLNYGDSRSLYLNFYSPQHFFKNFWDCNISASVSYNTYHPKVGMAVSIVNNFNYNFNVNNTFYLSKKKKWLAFAQLKYYSPIENISYSRENILFTTDIGARKTIKNCAISLYLTDLFNTGTRTRQVYAANTAFAYNQIIQNNYTRSISLSVRYSLGNNKLNQIKSKKSANEDIKSRIN